MLNQMYCTRSPKRVSSSTPTHIPSYPDILMSYEWPAASATAAAHMPLCTARKCPSSSFPLCWTRCIVLREYLPLLLPLWSHHSPYILISYDWAATKTTEEADIATCTAIKCPFCSFPLCWPKCIVLVHLFFSQGYRKMPLFHTKRRSGRDRESNPGHLLGRQHH
jgi:hypothetical protein